MKIDLYNNHKQFVQEQKQDNAIKRHCRRLGITLKKLETHPNIADLRVLMDFDQYESWMTEKDRQIWSHTWQWVYKKEFALTEYHRRKLRSILDGIEFKQRRMKHIQARLDRRRA
jgi:hypothetical protein